MAPKDPMTPEERAAIEEEELEREADLLRDIRVKDHWSVNEKQIDSHGRPWRYNHTTGEWELER